MYRRWYLLASNQGSHSDPDEAWISMARHIFLTSYIGLIEEGSLQ